jgi:hypothetical protein
MGDEDASPSSKFDRHLLIPRDVVNCQRLALGSWGSLHKRPSTRNPKLHRRRFPPISGGRKPNKLILGDCRLPRDPLKRQAFSITGWAFQHIEFGRSPAVFGHQDSIYQHRVRERSLCIQVLQDAAPPRVVAAVEFNGILRFIAAWT